MVHHLITLMVFLPLVGALFQALLPKVRGWSDSAAVGRWTALAASVGSSVCALALVISMQGSTPELQATETLPWVGSYAISYEMGVDGLNAIMVLLVALIFPVLIAYEWNQKTGVRGVHGLFLVLQTAFFGAVCAQDLFLLFFFWSLSALPFYFLIGIWGGEKRETAGFRYMVAASLGNALLFAMLILVYYAIDPHGFSIHALAGGRLNGKTFEMLGHELSVPGVAFGLTCVGLALRAPIWPLHGWFSQTAEEASPSVFVALSAVTVPVAAYIFVRLCYSLFPETMVASAHWVVVIGVVNLLMGGICAVAQRRLNLLLAYITMSGVGFILIGFGSLSPAGVVGAVYEQLVLGLGLAGFGVFAGLITERLGHSMFLTDQGERALGGIVARSPSLALVAGVFIASLLGFPGLGGFVGGALLTIGSYSVHPMTIFPTGAAFLMANYCLFTMYRCVFFGKIGAAVEEFSDLSLRERAYLMPLVVGLLLFGLYPKPLLELVRPTVLTLLSAVK
ncbi:NADH-quinone oxidoreductase subunit M [Bdellovibrionota bacterium FG-1]